MAAKTSTSVFALIAAAGVGAAGGFYFKDQLKALGKTISNQWPGFASAAKENLAATKPEEGKKEEKK